MLLLGTLVCVVASIAVAGSALATGGKDPGSARKVPSAVTAEKLSSGKPFTVKIKVTEKGGEALALIPVKVGDKELAFVVDTGASTTQITSKYADELGLEKIGKPVTVSGVGCKSKAQKVKIDDWSIGGHALPTAVIGSSTLAIGKGTPLAGLLGSDVWSRFGSLKIDYANQTLTVG